MSLLTTSVIWTLNYDTDIEKCKLNVPHRSLILVEPCTVGEIFHVSGDYLCPLENKRRWREVLMNFSAGFIYYKCYFNSVIEFVSLLFPRIVNIRTIV